MKENLNILHVVYSCFPKEFRGGIAKIVYELGQAQARLGGRVVLYTTNYNSTIPVDVPLKKNIRHDRIKICYFPLSFKRWFVSPSMRERLIDDIKKFDVVHSHNTYLALNYYTLEASTRSGVPSFHHVHGALDPRLVKKGFLKRLRKEIYIRLFEKRILNQAAAVFANTSDEASQIKQYGVKSPVEIVPNGIGGPLFKEGDYYRNEFRGRFGISQKCRVILYLGRIVPKKGLHLLIKAFGGLLKLIPDIVLVIGGDREQDKSYTNFLERIIEEHQIQKNVYWTGYLDEAEKTRAFLSADIFSHASESEGMAMSILEAMSYGLPVIVSKGCYMGQAAASGAIVECEYTENSLFEKLQTLLSDQHYCDRMGIKAAEYIRENHSWEQIALKIDKVYRSKL